MRHGFRLFLLGALGAAAFAMPARAVDGDRVTFDTLDGVTLEGTFYAPDPAAKPKQATVLLLHNIGKSGGSSHQDNWDDLAKSLSADGYAVLGFDFRGFGNSHSVNKNDFWDRIKGRHNLEAMPQLANRMPDTIDHKDFDGRAAEYYPYLVNDIAAAKAYLDRQNDQGRLNSSSLFVVGAGEGATLGAMWMASDWHLKRVSGRDLATGKYTYDEPEGRDQAGAVWLDISPKLGGREVPSAVRSWMADMAGENKVPMVFVYGKDNAEADAFAKAQMKSIELKVRHDNPGWNEDKIKTRLQFTNVKPIEDTKVVGSALLGVGDTQAFIQKYIDKVMDDRGPREARKHDMKEDAFLWTFPGSPPLEAKERLEDNLHLIPVTAPWLRSGGG